MNIEKVTPAIPVPPRFPTKEGAPKLVVGAEIALRYEGQDKHGVTVRRDRGPSLRLPPHSAWAQGLHVGDTVWLRVLAIEPSLELEFVSIRSTTSGASLSPDELHAMRLDQAAMRNHQWKLPTPGELAAAWRVILASRHMDQGLQSLALTERAPPFPGQHWTTNGEVLREQPETRYWSFQLYAWGGMNVTLRVAAKSLWERRRPATVTADVQGIEVALSMPQAGAITVQLLCTNSGLAMALLPRNPHLIPPLRDLIPELAHAFGRLGCPLNNVRVGAPLSPLPFGGLSYRPGPSSSVLVLALAEVVSCVARHWPIPPYADSSSIDTA